MFTFIVVSGRCGDYASMGCMTENNPVPLWELSRSELLNISKDDLIDSIQILSIRLSVSKEEVDRLKEEIENLNDPTTQERESYERMSLREINRLTSSD
jgi:hypothetical protein